MTHAGIHVTVESIAGLGFFAAAGFGQLAVYRAPPTWYTPSREVHLMGLALPVIGGNKRMAARGKADVNGGQAR